jgi:hypothetical protein
MSDADRIEELRRETELTMMVAALSDRIRELERKLAQQIALRCSTPPAEIGER